MPIESTQFEGFFFIALTRKKKRLLTSRKFYFILDWIIVFFFFFNIRIQKQTNVRGKNKVFWPSSSWKDA